MAPQPYPVPRPAFPQQVPAASPQPSQNPLEAFREALHSRVGANALLGFGAGMLSGDMSNAARLAFQGRALDMSLEEARRRDEMAKRYADTLRGWGPDYEQFAMGLETGSFDPAEAYFAALDYRKGLEDQTAQQERLTRNAQLLPEGPWRDAYTGGALDFSKAYEWSQGGGAPEMTDTQTNLSWRAAQAGLQPGTPEYQNFMLTGGGGGGTSLTVDPSTGVINFSQGGGKFNQTVDAAMGGEFATIQKDALNAVSGLQTLDAMEQAMADPSFYSGFGADQLLGLKQAAAAIGIDPEGVKSMETFRALSNKAVLDAMGGSLGTGVSNADRSFVEAQVAQLANTPEGNRAIIGIHRKLAERKIQMAELADRYRAANGNLNGFPTYLAQWAEQNPLFQSGQGGAVDMGGGVTIRQVR